MTYLLTSQRVSDVMTKFLTPNDVFCFTNVMTSLRVLDAMTNLLSPWHTCESECVLDFMTNVLA